MKMNRKAAVGAVALLSVSTAALAMTPPAAAAEGAPVAFSPISLSIPALQQVAMGFKAIETKFGNAPFVLDPNFNATKQATQLTQVISTGKAKGAWVISVKPAAIGPVAKLAQAKGVPMVLNGVPADYGFKGPQKGLAFARIDYNKQGAAVGTTLGQCINTKLGGNAEVIFVNNPAGIAGKAEMEAAMQKWLAKTAPNAKIVATIPYADRAATQTQIAAALQAHPSASAIMAVSDEGALGGLGALKAAGKKTWCISETGGNDEVLAEIKAGNIYASAAIQFAEGVFNDLTELDRLMKNPKATGKLLSEPLKVIMQ